jgi:hypothetical protein
MKPLIVIYQQRGFTQAVLMRKPFLAHLAKGNVSFCRHSPKKIHQNVTY